MTHKKLDGLYQIRLKAHIVETFRRNVSTTSKAMESLFSLQLLIEGYGFSTAYLSADRSN
jgi:hypothetical protein